jgi:hypothetical protein
MVLTCGDSTTEIQESDIDEWSDDDDVLEEMRGDFGWVALERRVDTRQSIGWVAPRGWSERKVRNENEFVWRLRFQLSGFSLLFFKPKPYNFVLCSCRIRRSCKKLPKWDSKY